MRLGSQSAFVVIDRSSIALIREGLNRIEVYRLEACPSASAPLLQMMCLLGLPPVTSTTSVTSLLPFMEWVPTSRHYKWSRSSRGYYIPFYSSAVGTIRLLLYYHMASGYSLRCPMAISVAGLLSVIRTGVYDIPRVDWGPSITYFYQEDLPLTVVPTIGPFSIAGLSPLTVRDYGLMCMGDIESMAEDMSPWQSRPRPVEFSTKVHGPHWVGNHVETYLPYRYIIANDLHVDNGGFVQTDREWIVRIGYGVRGFCI